MLTHNVTASKWEIQGLALSAGPQHCIIWRNSTVLHAHKGRVQPHKKTIQLPLTATTQMPWKSWKWRICLGLSLFPHPPLFALGHSDLVYWGIKVESVQLHAVEKYYNRYSMSFDSKLNAERAVGLPLLLNTAQALWHVVHCWSRGTTFSQELLPAFAVAVPSMPVHDMCLPFFFLAITQSQTFNQLICQDKTNF